MSWFEPDKHLVKSILEDAQADAQQGKVVVEAPGYAALQKSDGLEVWQEFVDDEAEHVVVGVEFSASAALNFYLENGDGQVSIKYFLGANSGDFKPTWIPMGVGQPIKYTSSAGTLSLRVLYITKRNSSRRAIPDVTIGSGAELAVAESPAP